MSQSGGCCDSSSPTCLRDGELPPSPNDLLLGQIAGAPFYVDCEQYDHCGRPQFVIDVGSGAAEGLSLSARFVTRSPGAPWDSRCFAESRRGVYTDNRRAHRG